MKKDEIIIPRKPVELPNEIKSKTVAKPTKVPRRIIVVPKRKKILRCGKQV